MYKVIDFKKADDEKHKYIVILKNLDTNRTKTIKFGAYGMSDFTQHKDNERKERYIERHKKKEDWNDPSTKGFWSRWILWNKSTVQDSLKFTINKFNL